MYTVEFGLDSEFKNQAKYFVDQLCVCVGVAGIFSLKSFFMPILRLYNDFEPPVYDETGKSLCGGVGWVGDV